MKKAKFYFLICILMSFTLLNCNSNEVITEEDVLLDITDRFGDTIIAKKGDRGNKEEILIQKGEEIIIEGDPILDCKGSSMLVEFHDGSMDCWCNEGYVEDGEHTFGNESPNCVAIPPGGPDDIDGEGNNQPPNGGGDSGGENNDTPTVEECKEMEDQCLYNAYEKVVQDCISARVSVVTQLLKNQYTACGQSTEELLDGFGWRGEGTLGWWGKPYDCTVEDLKDIDNVYTDNCRRQFLNRGLARCLRGYAGRSKSYTNSVSTDVTVDFGGVSVSTGSNTETETINYPGHLGIIYACEKKGIKAADACKRLGDECTNEAKGVSPMLVAEGEFGPSFYIDKIDKQLLGISENDDFRPAAFGLNNYFGLEHLDHESFETYTERLRFLARLSTYLETYSLSENQVTNLNLTLFKVQEDIHDLYNNYLVDIILWETEITMDEWNNSGDFGNLTEPKLLGSDFEKIDNQFRIMLSSVIGRNKANSSISEVWPGSTRFGLLSPMQNVNLKVAAN